MGSLTNSLLPIRLAPNQFTIMTVIVFSDSELRTILATAFEWHCSVNPEKKDSHPQTYFVTAKEATMFKSATITPKGIVSQELYASVTEVIHKTSSASGPFVAIYTKIPSS